MPEVRASLRHEEPLALDYGHHFRLEHPTDIDAALERLVRESYVEHAQEPTR